MFFTKLYTVLSLIDEGQAVTLYVFGETYVSTYESVGVKDIPERYRNNNVTHICAENGVLEIFIDN